MGLQVDRVPALAATFFFWAILPAIARVATMGTSRAKIITSPKLQLRKGVLQFMPAKAEPLLPPAEE